MFLIQNLPSIQNNEDLGVISVLVFILSVCLVAIAYLYKERAKNQKEFDERLDKKELKIDELIKVTTDDFKKIIEDGYKDKIANSVLLDKVYDVLAEVKKVLHDRNG